ncbi:hypothetical protein [Streptomyces hygroscopicus]|uniref:hypothetical protein n=1 Tax=Streptomyces hygroscopicus TaxID=1912 RepID=UPI0036B0A7A7
MTTPWPRTEWTINRDANTLQPGHVLLVGDGPSFLNFDQALSAFLHQRPHDSNAGRSDLWRIVLPQRAGWLSQITISPDLLTAVVHGEALDGAVLELSWAAGNERQSVDGADAYRFALPNGVAHDSLLMLRRADQWLDWRHFRLPRTGAPATPRSSGSSPARSWNFSWPTGRESTWSANRRSRRATPGRRCSRPSPPSHRRTAAPF